MLNDPEAPTEIWTDYVWATDEAEATQKCQAKAQIATMDGKALVRLEADYLKKTAKSQAI
ncbi:MAG: hypothetical protein F6K47_08620 [Symploca sp. SIO2E6]|nr:hypothetical protein [Symploca sp. SIO2E6]